MYTICNNDSIQIDIIVWSIKTISKQYVVHCNLWNGYFLLIHAASVVCFNYYAINRVYSNHTEARPEASRVRRSNCHYVLNCITITSSRVTVFNYRSSGLDSLLKVKRDSEKHGSPGWSRHALCPGTPYIYQTRSC